MGGTLTISQMEQHRDDYLHILSQGPPFVATKRNHSQDDSDLLHIKDVRGLRRDIRRIIIDRLARHGVSTEGIPALMLEHCLPKNDAYAKDWKVLIHTPLKVSDQMLLDMLGLRTAMERTQPDKGSRQTFVYIRSFQLTVVQLIDIIAEFHGTGLQYAKATAWLRSIEMMRPQELVFVRYVGRTTREALRRHREDLLIRKTGFLARFLSTLEKNYPMVIDSAMIHVFPARQLKGLREVSKYNRISEQAAIALLGLPYLLNQAMTDFVDWQFDPSPSYRQAFVALATDTISRMSPSKFHKRPAPMSLIAWGNEIQRYAREHKQVVSVWRNRCHEFPDLLKHMMVKQATPSLFEGKYVLMLTVGAGISHGSYRTAEAFYTGYSSSATLIKSFLSRLWQWEQSTNCVEYALSDLIDAGAFPFVDLCPWHKAEGSNLQAAAGFLKQYIGLAKPLIMLTFSVKPSSLIASGFERSQGSASDFWTRVGNLKLVHPAEGLCCIQIPCFHPGQGRYSIKPAVFLKVFDMTLWVLLLTINVTLDSMAKFDATDRHDWCEFIKANVESILRDQGFWTKFNNLKASLIATAVATRKDVDRYIYSGYAVDGSMSTRRRQQVYRLWIMDIPELHVHINRDRAQDWFTWANHLEEGTSFFVHAMAQAVWQVYEDESFSTTVGPRVSILQFLKGLSLGDRLRENLTRVIDSRQKWASSKDVLETLTLELSTDQWLWQQMHDEPIHSSLSVAVLSRYKPLYQAQLNGREVFLWKNRSLALHWASPLGVNYKFVLRAPKSSQNETFLEQPLVRKHPRISIVRAWTRDLLHTHKTSQMMKNLAHLCRISEKKKIQARDRERIQREGKDVKIAAGRQLSGRTSE
ncbi:hypothetical protein GB937_003159 [Aspergillus fischeri]|nr:hypothetical protein GB937_003159 [Aspergillus fischeri]